MNEQQEPVARFTGLFIPSEILNLNLPPTMCMLLAWIDALHSDEYGGCFASNKYFAEKLHVKKNTINIMLSKATDFGLIERVSFNGRRRVIRACKERWGQKYAKCESHAEYHLNDMQSITKMICRVSLKSHPLLIRDTSIYTSLDTPHIPPLCESSQKSAVADVGVALKSAQSKTRAIKHAFSESVHEVHSKMLELLQKHVPVYRPARDPTAFLLSIQTLLEDEQQNIETVLKAFEYAVSDTTERGDFKGWQGVIATNTRGRKKINPAEMLRIHLIRLCAQMNSKPARKFCPSSNFERSLTAMEEMDKNAL